MLNVTFRAGCTSRLRPCLEPKAFEKVLGVIPALPRVERVALAGLHGLWQPQPSVAG